VNRALRAATTGALLVSPLVLGACSAGQVNQTSSQVRDKVGGTADVENILLRAMEVANPAGGAYEAGDDAELLGAIVNSADEPDTLLSISGEGFEGVRVLGGEGTGTGVSSGSGIDSEVAVEIPTDGTVFLGSGDAPTILLENLTEELTTGQNLTLTLTFETAGEVEVTALVDNPEREVDRGEAFDFHHEEGAEGAPEGVTGADAGGE
jgi:copper(I)-binding protein